MHAPHPCHTLTAQSAGQGNALHPTLSEVSGQGVAPILAVCEMTRVREATPPSQVCVHVLQEVQAVTAQLLEGVGVVGANVGSWVGDWTGGAVGAWVGEAEGGS